MLHTDDEIREMLRIGRDHGMEVSLFVGPRAAWDVGAQVKSSAGGVLAGALRGADQLAYALADVRRGCDLGLRGILVADPGLLWAVASWFENRGANIEAVSTAETDDGRVRDSYLVVGEIDSTALATHLGGGPALPVDVPAALLRMGVRVAIAGAGIAAGLTLRALRAGRARS